MASLPLSCDDTYLSLLLHVDEIDFENNLISDTQFAQHLQLQEAIMASLNSSHLKLLEGQPSMTMMMITNDAPKETGESSGPICEICADHKDSADIFPILDCSHKFCLDCISRHVSIMINRLTVLKPDKSPVLACPAPDCQGILEMDTLRVHVAQDVVAKWDEVVCEVMIAPSQRFYCPYKDCSGLMMKDVANDEVLREAECPFCRRLMCVRCNVPWHSGIVCEEYQRLGWEERGNDDLMVHELAKKNEWRRCGHCRIYVEKKDGCIHMTCRCGHQFCYRCGENWTPNHGC